MKDHRGKDKENEEMTWDGLGWCGPAPVSTYVECGICEG